MKERTNTAKWLDKQNRWQIAVQKDGVRKTFTSSRPGREGQREANRKADDWLASGVCGTKLHLSELHESYMEQLKIRTSQSNWRPQESRWKTWIDPRIGHLKADALCDGILQKVIDYAYNNGKLSKKYLQSIRADMVSFCKYLRKMKVTGFVPEDITIPKGAPVGVRNILQPEDIVTLFSVDTTIYKGKLVKDPYINAYRLEVLTGLRPGELRGIMRNDFKQGRLEVRRSINEDNEITTGKNENAIRSVYLGEIAEAIVKDQASKSNGLYLFQMPTTETYRKFFQRYCKANGIPKTTPYELRHTFVSLAQSLPEGWVKQLVGHSKSMDTFGVYGHAVSGMDRQITSALDGVFTSILGQQEKK